MRFVCAFCPIIVVFSLSIAHAQPAVPSEGGGGKDSAYSLGITAGRMLPFQIFGVRDIYPYWGLRFGHPFGSVIAEYAGFFTMARGVRYYNFSASLGFPSEIEGWKFIPLVGLDFHRYSGRTSARELGFAHFAGFHLGFSPLLDISPRLQFRADFKFNFNPGRSLQVGAGLQFQF